LLKGDAKTALNSSYSLVITEKMAIKMFGTTDALNQVIAIDSNNFTVTGIMKNLPANTTFDFEMMLPWSYMVRTGQDDQNWGNNSCRLYLRLKPGTNVTAFNNKIQDVTKRHSAGAEQQEIFLHHISKWHLYSRFENGKIAGGRIELVRMLAIIAGFILLIACINFMNLSTARSEKRAKEVGIRKVAGAHKGLLVTQFLGESLLLATFAGVIAVVIVTLCLPSFNTLVGKELVLPFNNVYVWLAALAFIVLSGVTAGSYPAFFLSSFKPSSVLKGTFKKSAAVVNRRKVLVVVQFTFAIILVISTIIVTQQIRHAQTRESGYDRGPLVYHWLAGDLYKNYNSLKNELLRSGAIVSITRTNSPLSSVMSNTWGYQWAGKRADDKTIFNTFTQDEGLVTTAGFELLMGRDLDLQKFPSDSTGMLLNESAMKAMGFKQPLGQIVRLDHFQFTVVGVIKDFVLESPFETIRPMAILGAKTDWYNVINMKLNPNRDVAGNLADIEKIFTRHNPAYPYEYHFADDDYKLKFLDQQRFGTLTTLFASLAIFISCLGLFGLAAYMAENRAREIGIRKVLGASVPKIMALLSREFIMLVLISLVIATPVAWYVMHSWLEGFTYRVNIEWWIFVLAGVASMLISLITVSYQAMKAAFANPIRSLRTE
jgi:putative ABC transport system permease protein